MQEQELNVDGNLTEVEGSSVELNTEETVNAEDHDGQDTADGVAGGDEEDIIPENDEYLYLERVQVSNDKHKARLREDFGFLGDLKTIDVDGKRNIRDKDGQSIISDVSMTEKVFVDQWLDQFALGYVAKTNYFDATTWGKLTHGHQRGVMITDDLGAPLFVIPPLSRPVLTAMEQVVLDMAHKNYANASSAEQTGDSSRAQSIIEGTTALIKEFVSEDSVSVSEFIPEWFYTKYGVVPYIKRSMVYCRDIYGLNPQIKADWDMAYSVFANIHNKQALTEIQLKFMSILTSGEFTAPEYDVVEDLGNPQPRVQSNSDDFDPFEN